LEGGWGDVLEDAYIPLPPSKGDLEKNASSPKWGWLFKGGLRWQSTSQREKTKNVIYIETGKTI